MNVIKKLAPNYWLGYYAVYMASLIILTARYGRLVAEGSGSEEIFVTAAIFGAATGIALTSAIAAEGVGYLVLLIPRRIKQLKDEGMEVGMEVGMKKGVEVGREGGLKEGIEIGRAEGREDGLKEGIEIGRAEGRKEGLEEGIKTGSDVAAKTTGAEDERGRVRRLFALYDRGEITLDELHIILSNRLNGENGTD